MTENLKGVSVRKLFLKAFGLFACIAWSGMASAVGFGGINITSSLGQPLLAEIELVSVEQADKTSLTARLATPNAFKGAGIDYPYTLPKMTFAVESRANGESYVKVATTQAVNEPFVSLLIELSWASGRLLREYTFLLDPPGFVAEQPAVVAVAPIAPVVPVVAPVPVALPEPGVAEPTPVVIASAPVASEPEVIEAASAPVAEENKLAEPIETAELAPAKEEPVEEAKPVEPVTVIYGDTLGKIAIKAKASDVSLERMLVALYRANAGAFSGHNMNRLRTGKVLRMPKADELANIQQSEAVKEVHAQVVDWNAYRQKLAAAAALAAHQGADQEVSGKISTAVVDNTAVAKEPAKEVLKLSKGDAPGDQTTTGGKTKTDRANSKEENAVATAKSLDEAAQRTALLEKNIKDMQRLVELKNAAAAKAASSVAPAASAVVVAKPKPIVPKVVIAPPTLMDEVLGNPVLLGGGAAALLGLLALIMMRTRKSKAGGDKVVSKDKGSATGRITAPVVPSPETGDFTNQSAPDTITTTTDDVDPIAEADMFLNFGRDVQAEEVLKDALSKDPSNNPVKLKLLSIYVSRKDTKSLYVYAMEIKESGDEAAWAQAAAMGLSLEPNNAAYGGSADEEIASPDEDVALPAVDFDLSMAGEEGDQVAATFDLDSAEEDVSEKTAIFSASEMQAAQEAVMDFDVTSTYSESNPAEAEAEAEEPALDVPAMDFDITSTHPGLDVSELEEPKLDMTSMDFETPAASEEKTAAVSADSEAEEPQFDMSSMDFETADVQGEKVEIASADAEAPSLNLDDLVFETPAEPSPSPADSAPVAEVEEDLAFNIDIPTEDEKLEEVAKPAPSVDLGDISLSLDDLPDTEAPAAEAEVKDERWQEVATKLDLAKAYQEMGDQAGASEILEEVVRDGDEKQRATAQDLLQQFT